METDPIKVREVLDSFNVGEATISPNGLVHVHGVIDLSSRGLTELPVLFQRIEGFLDITGNSIRTLGPLTSVGLDLYLNGTLLESLGELEEVWGEMLASDMPKLDSLGKLRSVGQNLTLYRSAVRSLGALLSVGDRLYIEEVPLVVVPDRKLVAERGINVGGDSIMSTWDLCSEMEDLYRLLRKEPQQAPLLLATARYGWQRAIATEFLRGPA